MAFKSYTSTGLILISFDAFFTILYHICLQSTYYVWNYLIFDPGIFKLFILYAWVFILENFWQCKKPGFLLIRCICSTLSLKQKLICESGLSLVPKSENSTSHAHLVFLWYIVLIQGLVKYVSIIIC